MAKLHIIGVGGTGHKIISAVVHLAACGAFKGRMGSNEISGINIVAVDADDSNGNLTETKAVVDSYNKFYNALNSSQNFNLTAIEPLSNIKLYQNDKKSINTAFNIPQYNGSDVDKFIRFLYTKEEIETEFDQGFYGHTSIGTLIVKDILTKDDKWQTFLKSGVSENDFVIVAGSIFGGTGASAIPVILEELKTIKKEKDSVKYAALILTPYFRAIGKINEDGELQPDSGNFNLKAKAALYYYYKQNQYENADAIYIIGEPQENYSNEEASRGSANQRNKAHPVELFAASAAIDFIKDANDRLDHQIVTAEREAENGENYYTWKMLKKIDAGLPEKIQKLVKAAVFYNKVLYGQLKSGSAGGTWEDNYDKEQLRTEKDDSGNFIYENIREYTKRLIGWFYDIHKKNLGEINQNTGRLKSEPDKRVKLFNADYSALFDIDPVTGGDIKSFESLVYNDDNSLKAAKIYSEICGKKPKTAGAKRMSALFDTLVEIITAKSFQLFGRKKSIPEDYQIIPFLSRDNSVTFKRGDADSEHLWAKAQPGLLTDIADALPFVISDKFTANDISIPSPWSIFISYELTLTEGKFSSLNKTAYNQWCGIITLLALREFRLYEKEGLELKQLALQDEKFSDEFVNIVGKTCIPYSYIFDNPLWTNCARVSVSDETIAFLAINTIVCPAYSLSTKVKGMLNKMEPGIVNEKGKFRSPDNYFADQSQKTNREAKYALILFLRKLKDIITEAASGNKGAIIKSLQDYVDKFISDLGHVEPVKEITLSMPQRPIHTVYDLFTEIRLKPPKQELPFLLTGTKKNAVLIGLNICGISSSSPAAGTIFITEKLKYSQINVTNVGTLVTDDGYELLYDETLLGDTMIVVNKGSEPVFNSLAGRGSIPDYEIIWPVSEKLLELYDVKAINDMLSVSKDAETITVSLELRLARGKHTVSRQYKIINGTEGEQNGKPVCYVFDRERLPLWAVWPYAEVLDGNNNNTWKRYNYFCIEPKQIGTVKVLEIEPVFRGSEDAAGFSASHKLSTITTNQRDKYYRRSKTLPAALKLFLKSDAHTPASYSGIVILEDPKKHKKSTDEWNIGLDFGTTSTTAFYSTKDDKLPEFLQILPEYTWTPSDPNPVPAQKTDNDLVVLSDSGGADKRDLELYFIDSQCLKQNSYITAYEVMDTASESTNDTIFETGRIFWHNTHNFRAMNSEIDGKRRGNLRTNIKWDGERKNVGKFLNQLLTQMVFYAAREGVRKLNCFFSYPTAFGPEARGDFTHIIESITKNLAQETGVGISFDNNHLITESIAAAYYFREQKKYQQLFLCVDIGGGTSDISIWIKDKNIFQSSVRFASRDMFVAPMVKLLSKESVMSEVRTGKTEDGIYTMLSYGGSSNISPDKIYFFIESVLFEFYNKFRGRLNLLSGEDMNYFKNFKYSVFISYVGLCYYLSNIVGTLFETGIIDDEITEIVLGLSGKGAKLTDWISTFCPLIYDECQTLIASKKRTEKEIRILPQFSPDSAKTETAKGLICNLDETGEQKSSSESAKPQIYLGGNIELQRGKEKNVYGKDRFVDIYEDEFIKTPEKLTVSIDSDLADFSDFISFFNRIAGKTQGDMPEISNEWYKKNKKNLRNQIKTAFEKHLLDDKRFEPPFIVMLKVFLDYYSEEYLYAKK
jgi:hypothetical protein